MNCIKQTDVPEPAEMKSISAQIKQFLEVAGIYIFITSSFIWSQLRLVKKYNNYSKLELRLAFGLFAGMILSYIVVKLIRKIMSRYNKDDDSFIRDLSFALSPGILFILGSITKKFLLLGVILCVLTALYVWVKSFRDFIDSIIFIAKFKAALMIKDGKALMSIQGTYENDNPKAMQSFLSDLSINFYECAEMKVDEIRIDFSGLKERNEDELKPIMESIARYFHLKIVY